MQKFKDPILKILCSAVIFFTYLLVMPSVWMAEGADVPPQIFIGDTPSVIIVQRGASVEVPVFFVGGTSTGKKIELYAFRSKDGGYVCLGPEGWESDYAMVLEDFKPLLNIPSLPEYFLLRWQAVEDSQSDFDLWVCVDEQVEDGIPTIGSLYCGCKSIIVEEVDGDTGDGDDDGGTGDVGSPGLVAPPFPNIGGDSGGPCDSLEYNPEGTTYSQSSISKSLELGESEQITLLTLACGNPVTVSSVNKTSGGEWLSASSGGGSKVILNLNAGATGLQAGETKTGTVTVVAGGITDNMYVTLRVLGQCDPTSASVTPTSLTFQAYVGGQNPSAQTLRVKDNCGDAVSATVSSKPNWLTLTPNGTGVFLVSCSEQSEGSYSGTITLRDNEYNQEHSVSVTLKVTETSSPTPTPDDSVTTVPNGHVGYYDVGADQTRFFKFVSDVPDCQHSIQVSNTPGSSDQPCTVHLLIKRGSIPTKADFERTWEMRASYYDCTSEQWIPAKDSTAENLYWKYNTGSQAEFVKVNEPMESNTFYIMLYNKGTKAVYDQYLTVHYND